MHRGSASDRAMRKPNREYDIITFDCYGTLIDWEAGISNAFTRAAEAEGRTIDHLAILREYAELEPEVESERYRTYSQVLAETARRVAAHLCWPLTEERATFLVESLPTWQPFPDVDPALERLVRAGYRLGILSNVDDDLLAATLRHFHVRFDLLVTAQQVESYKPAPGHFLEARRRIGNLQWLHAAQSYFHDIVPSQALGIPVAWINRKNESQPAGRLHVRGFPTLTELADWLAP